MRLPMDYRCWTDEQDLKKFDEAILKHLDQAVEYGKQYGVHVSLNLHRAPGYCVNPPEEKLDLWTSEEALELFCYQWRSFAERYKGIPNSQISFNLLNEPAKTERENYIKVVRATAQAIHEADPERLVIIDAFRYGREPVFELANENIAQSTRGYDPMYISHYKASWVNMDYTDPPTWSLKRGNKVYDKEYLKEEVIAPFVKLAQLGVGVHVGEFGSYNRTPHDAALAWMSDFLSLWKEQGWGWASGTCVVPSASWTATVKTQMRIFTGQ